VLIMLGLLKLGIILKLLIFIMLVLCVNTIEITGFGRSLVFYGRGPWGKGMHAKCYVWCSSPQSKELMTFVSRC